jgi:hypothetical protein
MISTQILNWSQSSQFAKMWNRQKNRGFGAVQIFDWVKPVATVPGWFQPGPRTEPPIWNRCLNYILPGFGRDPFVDMVCEHRSC